MSHLPQIGDYLEAGRTALAIVSEQGMWVEANFKETDLGKLRIGQPADVEIDTYGGKKWKGRVSSIAQATGAEFALLPAQNASGNWVKVVQRIPVRIALESGPERSAAARRHERLRAHRHDQRSGRLDRTSRAQRPLSASTPRAHDPS